MFIIVNFSEQVRLDTKNALQVNIVIASLIYLIFAIFDYFYLSSIIHITLPLRIVNIIILWIIFFLCKKNYLKSINLLGIFAFGFTSSIVCIYNIIVIKYQALPFWGSFTAINLSLFLFIFTASLNMYWESKYTFIVSSMITLTFVLTHTSLISNYPGIPLSIFLLVSASIIAVIISKRYYNYHLRDYNQKRSLREANQDLQHNLKKVKKMLSIERKAKKEKRLRKKVEELNSKLTHVYKSRESFFSELSHEMRTPLTSIFWKLDQILENRKDGNITLTADEIETLYSHGQRLIYKLNNILDLAQYENKKKLYVGKYNLEVLTSEFVNENLFMIKSKDVDFNFQSFLTSKNCNIYCDKEEMNKVFFNLFHNSLKYISDNGYIQIWLFENKQDYTIKFRDDGVGISKEIINNILEEFSKGNPNEIYMNRYYPQIPSSGLGLALAKQAISSHKGSISVKSKHIKDSPDQHGTILTIRLPKGKAHFKNSSNVKFIKSEKKY